MGTGAGADPAAAVDPQPLGRVVVIGAGLIGTSVALALTTRGVQVVLRDRDPAVAVAAAARGAGRAGDLDGPADLAVVAVPPLQVAPVLLDAQRAGLAATYTDVTSVKAAVVAGVRRAGGDLSGFVPGHPMAGREVSGPRGALAELFTGRPWVLTPLAGTAPEHLARARALVALCGAVLVETGPEEHDRAVALVSHLPQVLASLTAARLRDADPGQLRLAGAGLRDTTRVAGSDPELWAQILQGNAAPVAALLRRVQGDLDRLAGALEALTSSPRDLPAPDPLHVPVPEGHPEGPARVVLEALQRGRAGRERIPPPPSLPSAPDRA